MDYYALNQNNEQRGPFTLQELKEKGIRPTTLVWHEGMQDWMEAGTVDDLKSLFLQPPTPPKPTISPSTYPPSNTPTETSDKVLAIVICFMLASSLVWGLIRLNPEAYDTDWFLKVNALSNLLWALVPLALATIVRNKSLQVVMYVLAAIQLIYGLYTSSELLGM